MSVGEVTVPPFVVSKRHTDISRLCTALYAVFADSTIDVPLSNS